MLSNLSIGSSTAIPSSTLFYRLIFNVDISSSLFDLLFPKTQEVANQASFEGPFQDCSKYNKALFSLPRYYSCQFKFFFYLVPTQFPLPYFFHITSKPQYYYFTMIISSINIFLHVFERTAY